MHLVNFSQICLRCCLAVRGGGAFEAKAIVGVVPGTVCYHGAGVALQYRERGDLVARIFVCCPEGDMLKVDLADRIAHARRHRAAEGVRPAEFGIIIRTVLGSRVGSGDLEVVSVADSDSLILAPLHCIGRNAATALHADDGAAVDRTDDGIGGAVGRDLHADRITAVRHTRVWGNRAGLEEQIGIPVPQSIVLGEILLAQLLKVQLE